MTNQTSVFSLDSKTMDLIERKLRVKREMAQAKEHELFDVFKQELTEEEAWALKYLYAYMPVNDMADYNSDLFLSYVRQSLEIRKTMPWGSRVPDHLFLHFVLPYRVNTENIEDSRGILHQELNERTRSLSMADAILETNYWCHEKATYIGSDLRTIAPLSLIRNARGRCGEESTLAVAALRSIGIPARQVYTPRWAHCDSNHAWVEAWADGTWYYIGACEPEARLNQGWFSPPARRAMLINTRIYADYPGPEDITLADEWFTEINLLENYAPTRTITVSVKDEEGRPVSEAQVHFELYNTAEFYPIATIPTNEQGEAVFKTGLGDLLIRAVKNGVWGEQKITVADSDYIEMVLDQTEQPYGTHDLDMVPPREREGEAVQALSEDHIQQHNRRLEAGTKLRTSYEDTFMTEAAASELATEVGLPVDRVWDVLCKARGNSHEIAAFLREQSRELGEWPLRLLESLNEKDLVDTFRDTLRDHLHASLAVRGELAKDMFTQYVLCPRVLHEMIVPYKHFFQEAFTSEEAAAFKADPAVLACRLDEPYSRREDLPNLKGKGNPVGTYMLMAGDPVSLDILFVAICRSLGIPARLHPSELKPQYLVDGVWVDAVLNATVPRDEAAKSWGGIRLLKDASASSDAPEASYFENFSFARLEHGLYKTLLFAEGKKDVYDQPFEVEPGSYRMTTGVRLKDGAVQVRFTYFQVRAGEETDVALTFRHAEHEIPVLGMLDRQAMLTKLDGASCQLGEVIGEHGALVAWIEPEREPTKHLFREIGELTTAFTELDAPIVLIIGDAEWTTSFDPADYPQLPKSTLFIRDASYGALSDIISQSPAHEAGFPHLFVLDEADQIRYMASGYKIGTGKESLQVLSAIQQ
ncbi:transglutaminase domain-containing protein [Paenibacillus motobuensis]|uniref:transglutaminase domain-containing protein n=1 Tax=Paenibacillus TaxID=44249 RepID=UPI00203AF9C0|nr:MULTISPECIES: transglutaminase domain-containing protein [Paenibacillus]MCM3038540.1 transglutaminase domain-containing protein [Paenibacillus lutimineralis]MCM3645644.1 transglutaminase domain-containing protein [Paenibacillus motobuensis]